MDGEHWQLEPDEHDFPAARTYLSLICSPSLAGKLVKLLERAPTASARRRISFAPVAFDSSRRTTSTSPPTCKRCATARSSHRSCSCEDGSTRTAISSSQTGTTGSALATGWMRTP